MPRIPLSLLFLATIPCSLSAQAVRDSVITVSASRVSRIVPDRASFYVVVEGTAETATDAVARVETKLKAVTDALKTFGARVDVDRAIAYAVGPTPAPNGYPGVATPASNLARSVIRVQITRPEQVAHVIAAALTAGAASTSTLSFESSATDSVRRARIGEVLGVAKLDATTIATSLGGRLGGLVDVSSTTQLGFQQSTTLNFDNRFGQQSLAPEIAITTSATVRYKLLP